MNSRILLAISLAATTAGCSFITSGQPASSNNSGEAWYVRTTDFLGLPTSSTIYYCSAESPRTCRAARIRSIAERLREERRVRAAQPNVPPKTAAQPPQRGQPVPERLAAPLPFAGSQPPSGLAGFELAATAEDAHRVCDAAGAVWSELDEDWQECTGKLEPAFGATLVRAELRFCNQALCRVDAYAPASAEGLAFVDDYAAAKKSIRADYGPGVSESKYGLGCRESRGPWLRCLANGDATILDHWRWRTSERLKLTLTLRNGAPTLLFRLERATD